MRDGCTCEVVTVVDLAVPYGCGLHSEVMRLRLCDKHAEQAIAQAQRLGFQQDAHPRWWVPL